MKRIRIVMFDHCAMMYDKESCYLSFLLLYHCLGSICEHAKGVGHFSEKKNDSDIRFS
jgi:hypothetical protein